LNIVKKYWDKKSLYTKLDPRWRNNMRIKKEDEWKTAFTVLESLFELTAILFRLKNSLAMFQAMMNELLQDLINTS